MQNAGYAALQIIPTFKGLQGNLERGTAGPLAVAGRSGGSRFGESAGRSITASVGSAAKTAAKLAAATLAGAGYAAFRIGKDSLAEARESQIVGARTASVIKSTGKVANVSAKEIDKLSTAISKRAGIDDETIASGANMLLTFTKIRNEQGKGNKVFNQATKAVTDYAAAMAGAGGEIDLKSASIQVGKALNDPVKGITALGKAGVQFTEDQKATIKSMVDSGDQMGAQKIILKELNTQFGGAAEAQATMGDKVSVAWGNIQEKLGNGLLPLVDKAERAFLKKGVPAIEGWVDALTNKGIPAVKDFVDDAKPFIESTLPAIETGLTTTRDVLKDAAPKAKALIDAFNDAPEWVKKGLVIGGLGGVAAKKTGLLGLLGGSSKGGGLLGLATKAKPLPVFVVNNAGGVGGAAGAAGGAAGAGAGSGAGAALAAAGSAALRVGGGWLTAGTAAGGGDVKTYKGLAITGGEVQDRRTGGKKEFDAYVNSRANPDIDLAGILSDTAGTYGGAAARLDALELKRKALAKALNSSLKAKIDISDADAALDRLLTKLARINGKQGGSSTDLTPRGFGGGAIQFHGPVTIRPNDSREFIGDMQRRAQRSSIGGPR